MNTHRPHHIVIVGGGFGGLYAAQAFRRQPVEVTLIDKRNFHLFQPLLYQVATGGLSPGDIASPLRGVLNRQKNTRVLLGEVVDIDPSEKKVTLRDDVIWYDSLILATGARHSYFGNDNWEALAPGLKTVEDATEMRRRIFLAFEAAEREPNPAIRQGWMNFIIVGGGPTGVELAGALAELAHHTLVNDFREIDPREAHILLLEGSDRILPAYPEDLSHKATRCLEKLGVTVKTNHMVTSVKQHAVIVKHEGQEEIIPARTVLWGAGVQASPLGRLLAEKTGAELDRIGRVVVESDLSLPEYPDIYVIGDLAHFAHQTGDPLPGVAPVAMQQGRYVARRIIDKLNKKPVKPFHYIDKGNMAVIGRAAAVADLKWLRMSGYPAWLAWLFIHLLYLVEYENRILVLIQWAWSYFTRNRGARLITGQDIIQLISAPHAKDRQSEANPLQYIQGGGGDRGSVNRSEESPDSKERNAG